MRQKHDKKQVTCRIIEVTPEEKNSFCKQQLVFEAFKWNLSGQTNITVS